MKTKTIIASTASPYKFNRDVLSALGEEPDDADDFELIEKLKAKSGMEIPKSLAELKTKEKRFEGVIDKNEMPSLVREFLKIK